MKKSFEDRSIPEPNTGCWLWEMSLTKDGYGHWGSDYAHRESYRRYNGPIASGLLVLHKCDQPSCVNPEHLFLGTHSDNMQDMLFKGRGNFRSGRNHPYSRLSEIEVAAIKLDTRYMHIIAQEYGIGKTAVFNIKHGVTYRDYSS